VVAVHAVLLSVSVALMLQKAGSWESWLSE
jgi:hypothetical protein